MNARFFSSIACLICLAFSLGMAAQQPVKKQTAPASKPAAATAVPAQNEPPILLVNPGFEDVPKSGVAPTGWFECGAPGETPPDIQPGQFNVSKPPQQGNSYLGLVVRDNETVEGVSQRLSRPLEANKCYTWSLQLCRSELYLSPSKLALTENVNYTTPVKLRVWGGSGYCNKKELLAETSAVQNTRWLQYDFRLQPKQTHTYIFIEAYYKTPVLFFYNGNIMVDNAGPILPIPCKEPPKPPKPPVTPPTQTATTPASSSPKPGPSANPAQTPVFTEKQLKVGEIIRVEKIQFDADRADVKPESYPAMQEIFQFLSDNKKVVVEIGGHTNNLPKDDFCDDLSTNRAKSVADYLVSKGIDQSRVKYKGYGKRYPISPNTTKEGRRKNQRVEVKILSVG